MIYPSQVDAPTAAKLHGMNFNLLPGLRRPTDFSVSSILGNSESAAPSPLWPPMSRLPSGLSLPGKLPDMFAAEMMLSQQHQLAMRGLEVNSESSEVGEDAQVELEGMDLWEQFHDIGTEMVITKCGRLDFALITSCYQNKRKTFFTLLVKMLRKSDLRGACISN